jgi:hypothetical protein
MLTGAFIGLQLASRKMGRVGIPRDGKGGAWGAYTDTGRVCGICADYVRAQSIIESVGLIEGGLAAT